MHNYLCLTLWYITWLHFISYRMLLLLLLHDVFVGEGVSRCWRIRIGMPQGQTASEGAGWCQRQAAAAAAAAVWHMCTMFAGISPLPDDVFMHFARLVVCLARCGSLADGWRRYPLKLLRVCLCVWEQEHLDICMHPISASCLSLPFFGCRTQESSTAHNRKSEKQDLAHNFNTHSGISRSCGSCGRA